MGLIDLFRGELLEIIEWVDDSRDTLAWRFPDDDKAIKNGAQLIVRESQVAPLVMTGQFADTFWQGKHTLSTPNVSGAGADSGAGNTVSCLLSRWMSILFRHGYSPATNGARQIPS